MTFSAPASAGTASITKSSAISSSKPLGNPTVTLGDFGNGVVAWPAQTPGLSVAANARLISETGALGPTVNLGPSSTCVDSDVAGNGTTAVAWTNVTLKVATAPLHGKFGPVRSLPSGAGCGEFKVIQTDTRTVLIWQSGTQLFYAIAVGSGDFGPATLVDNAQARRLDATHAADDSILVAYAPQWSSTPWTRTQIALKRLASNSDAFSERQIVTSDTAETSESDTLGFFTGAHRTVLGSYTMGGGPWTLRGSELQSSGQMTVPTTAGSLSYNATGGYASFEGPYMAPIQSGRTVAAWLRSVTAGYENDYPKESVLSVTTGSLGGTFGTARSVSTRGKIAECPAITSLGGPALLAWQERDYTGPTTLPKTRSVKLAVVDEFGNWTRLASPGSTSLPSTSGPPLNTCRSLKVASHSSAAVVVWTQAGRLMLARVGISFP